VGINEEVPMVSISNADAMEMQKQLQRGPVEVLLVNRIDSVDAWSQNVVRTITGSELPNEWIIVSARYDRRRQAAQDNGLGVATMLELARV
jgi:Zn-dependent M28 family amino/carboxypeptidase